MVLAWVVMSLPLYQSLADIVCHYAGPGKCAHPSAQGWGLQLQGWAATVQGSAEKVRVPLGLKKGKCMLGSYPLGPSLVLVLGEG